MPLILPKTTHSLLTAVHEKAIFHKISQWCQKGPGQTPLEASGPLYISINLFIIPRSIFIYLFIYLNWKLITLQYCSGFWHILTCISHGCTCVPPFWIPLPPPSSSHPSGLFKCTGFECPALCTEIGLVIYFTYGNIHVSLLFSQIIPLLPSARIQKSILYICVSFTVSHIGSSLSSL